MSTPPDVIYLQYFGCDKSDFMGDKPEKAPEVTWCEDKINDTDIRYVIDKRHKPKRKELKPARRGGR